MLIKGFKDISISRSEIRHDIVCDLKWGAHFKFHTDVRELFPLINGNIKDVRYCHRPIHVQFMYQDIKCTLYPEEAIAAPFSGHSHAFEFLDDLVVLLNDLYARRHELKVSHNLYRKPASIVDILKVLPRTNCKECGYPTCMVFASELRKGSVTPETCPGFSEPISVYAVYPVIGENGTVESTLSFEKKSSDSGPEKVISKKFLKTNKNSNPDKKKQLYDQNGIRIQYDLTPREVEVLRLVADGETNPKISSKLYISPHTVKSHIIHIFNKLNVNDRTQAAVWAVQNQII